MDRRTTIKANHEFRRIYAKGSSAASPFLAVYFRPNRTGGVRLGVTVSAKLGGAVVRNRVRRRLREIFRLHRSQLKAGCDVILVARGRAVSASYWELDRSFRRLCEKLSIWEGST